MFHLCFVLSFLSVSFLVGSSVERFKSCLSRMSSGLEQEGSSVMLIQSGSCLDVWCVTCAIRAVANISPVCDEDEGLTSEYILAQRDWLKNQRPIEEQAVSYQAALEVTRFEKVLGVFDHLNREISGRENEIARGA